ncbi:MAG: hypothetical protein ABJB12_23190 [Pseudomonadota bacterium]
MPTWSSISTRAAALALAAGACALTTPVPARADTLIIRHPGDHPRYVFEAEPHLLLGVIDPPGVASGSGFGAGFRGTVVIVPNGFVPSINNSVGIGFGLDIVHYSHGRLHCIRDSLSSGVCNPNDSESVNNFWLPVVMQWNFFLSREWSVFGEPGLAVRYESLSGAHATNVDPQFYLGGRWHFADRMTLTMRLGYPTFSVGVSFL